MPPVPPDFSEISPRLAVRISDRAKRLALRVDVPMRRVHLVIPKRASLKSAYAFALAHQEWIEKQLMFIPAEIPFAHGERIPVLDKTLTILIDNHPSHRVTEILRTDSTLEVATRLENPETRIARYLKNLAAEEFLKIANDKAAILGRKIENLTVRDMKTRWGSCSTDGRMALSWRLIFAPFEAYEYVISHEVAHLKHPNHGPRFWKLCEELSTDFSTGHTWMKENGAELMRFGSKAA